MLCVDRNQMISAFAPDRPDEHLSNYCAAPNADLRELLEQIEKVVQAAWTWPTRTRNRSALKLRGPSGPPMRRCAPTASVRSCRPALLAKAQSDGTYRNIGPLLRRSRAKTQDKRSFPHPSPGRSPKAWQDLQSVRSSRRSHRRSVWRRIQDAGNWPVLVNRKRDDLWQKHRQLILLSHEI